MDLRVFCLNARYCLGQDGEYCWVNRFPRIADLLDRLSPDIVAMQEVLPHQRGDLEQRMPGMRWLGLGRERTFTGEQCLLGVSPTMDLLQSDTVWLSDRPEESGSKSWDAALPRIATTAKLRHSGQEFRVVNVHLDHIGAQSRLESARLLQNRYLDETVILMGDLNAQPDSAPVRELLRTFKSGHEIDPHPTFHDYGRAAKGLTIDYIFYRGNLHLKVFEVFREQTPDYSSDHYPLLADFTFSALPPV